MKKITLILLFFSIMGNAQFFESDNTTQEEEPQNGSFSENNDVYDQPDQGEDASGNPGDPVPVNDWMYLLPVIGIGVGAFFLSRKRNLA